MTRVFQQFQFVGHEFFGLMRRFGNRHPYLAFFTAFALLPVMILLAVGVLSTVVILPFAWIFGWL